MPFCANGSCFRQTDVCVNGNWLCYSCARHASHAVAIQFSQPVQRITYVESRRERKCDRPGCPNRIVGPDPNAPGAPTVPDPKRPDHYMLCCSSWCADTLRCQLYPSTPNVVQFGNTYTNATTGILAAIGVVPKANPEHDAKEVAKRLGIDYGYVTFCN